MEPSFERIQWILVHDCDQQTDLYLFYSEHIF